MQVLDITVLAEQLLQIFLTRLLMHVGDEYDPALDRAHGYSSGRGVLIGRGGFGAVAGRGAVDLHIVGGHG